MSMTPITAWTILKAISLGDPFGQSAVDNLTKDEYDILVGEYQNGFASTIEVYTQLATDTLNRLLEDVELPDNVSEWNASDWKIVMEAIEGHRFEKLWIYGLTGQPNLELLWEFAKPEIV